MAPSSADVCLEDVAHHLSLKFWFNGATTVHYSVAQHSVVLSYLVPVELAYAALHHDDIEAFLPDVPTPVKPHIPGWVAIEDAYAQTIVIEFFGVTRDELLAVKLLDKRLAVAERELFLNPSRFQWPSKYKPIQTLITACSAEEAEQMFLSRHAELAAKNNLEPSFFVPQY